MQQHAARTEAYGATETGDGLEVEGVGSIAREGKVNPSSHFRFRDFTVVQINEAI